MWRPAEGPGALGLLRRLRGVPAGPVPAPHGPGGPSLRGGWGARGGAGRGGHTPVSGESAAGKWPNFPTSSETGRARWWPRPGPGPSGPPSALGGPGGGAGRGWRGAPAASFSSQVPAPVGLGGARLTSAFSGPQPAPREGAAPRPSPPPATVPGPRARRRAAAGAPRGPGRRRWPRVHSRSRLGCAGLSLRARGPGSPESRTWSRPGPCAFSADRRHPSLGASSEGWSAREAGPSGRGLGTRLALAVPPGEPGARRPGS